MLAEIAAYADRLVPCTKVFGNNVEPKKRVYLQVTFFPEDKGAFTEATCKSPNTFTFFLHTIKQLSSGVKKLWK